MSVAPSPAEAEVREALALLAPSHPRWRVLIRERPGEYTAALLGEAARVRARGVPVSRDVPGVVVRCDTTSWTGYGVLAAWLGRALEAYGVPVGYTDLGCTEKYLARDPFVASRVRGSFEARKCRVQLTPPTVVLSGDPDVFFTMWETSRLPVKAVANLNRARLVVVPCRWNAEGFAASGVTAPIAVVPLGVDTDLYRPMPFRDDGLFVVGMAARMAHGGVRKGINEGIRAWRKAFPREPDVRLRLKVWEDCLASLEIPDDPRIIVDTAPLRDREMPGWYANLDVFLSPSKGEGFGLHPLAAMAVGRPVIAAPVTGVAEYWEDRSGWGLGGSWGSCDEFYGGVGEWFTPDPSAMVMALRDAHAHPGEVRRRGAAAVEVAAPWTWWRTGAALYDVLAGAGYLAARRVPGRDVKALAKSCPHRETLSPCGCDGWCDAGRGLEIPDPRTGLRRKLVNLTDCGRCELLPGDARPA